MTVLRLAAVASVLLLAACSSPSPKERLTAAEMDGVAPLKQTYSGVVTGFDFPDDTTLVISMDANEYNGMDDDAQAAMKKAVLQTWRDVWRKQHPNDHANLTVKLNDFIGRTWVTQSIRV